MAHLLVQKKILRLGDTCSVGRDKTNNLAVNHASISREHGRVYRQDGGWFVEDLLSANGTTLNGKPLIGGPANLADGDEIKFGDVQVSFHLSESMELEDASASASAGTDISKLEGQELGGYKILALERQEVAGPLHRAKHIKTGREVLLWVLDPRIVEREDIDFKKRFMDILATAAGLKSPDLIRVFQCGCDRDLIWYTTEPPGGSTLAQLVHQGFSPKKAIEVILSLCRILHAYHEAGLVHGDIKPSLVSLDSKGHVHLGSFGLLGLNSVNRKLLQSEGATRQVFYLCPVQAKTGDCNVKSDLYSVGCILVHLLTGRPPFIGNNFKEVQQAHLEQPIPELADKFKLPPLFDEILASMLAKDPFNRFDDFGPVIRDFERMISGED
ncbi:MAG: FHA domain-containing serine/threonine-protein kinase [Planctomycetota bacterium]